MRVHLATLVLRVLCPDRRVNATSDLDIGRVLGVVAGQDITRGHGLGTVLDFALAVDTGASLIGCNRVDTVAGHEGAEVVCVVDGGNGGAGAVDGGAGHWLVGEGRGRHCDQDEEGLDEHVVEVCVMVGLGGVRVEKRGKRMRECRNQEPVQNI